MISEQIRNLIKECTVYEKLHGFYSEEYIYFNKEKFAELLIRECIDVANSHFESKVPGYPGDRIQEHFGIKS